MNMHNLNDEIASLLARSVNRFNTIRTQINHIKNIADKNNISGCIGLVDDFIELAIKYEKEDIERLINFLEETKIPEENINYKYFLITIRDNDYYMSLSKLGDIFVRVLGYEYTSDRFNFENFKIFLPDLVCTIFSICQDAHSDYVRKHLKICYIPEEINEFIEKYGMRVNENYENPLFKNDPQFKDVIHCDCNAESLIIKLAFSKENNDYIEEKSDWLVI